MKKSNKIISLLLAVFMLIAISSVQVSAVSDENVTFDTLNEYIEYSIPQHIYAQQIITSNLLVYSKPIIIYNFSNNEVVGTEIFIFDNDKMIGKMEIYIENNSFTSYFDTNITNEMTEAYANGYDVAIGTFEKSIYFYSSIMGFSVVDGLNDVNASINTPSQLSKITLDGSVYLENYIMPYAIATHTLNVPFVSNSTTYNSNGQCWAASVAMKLNYHKNLNLTADSVYEKMTKAGIDFDTNGTVKALNYFGYTDYSSTSSMSSGDVALALGDKKPIIIHISDKNNVTHAVVISGIVLDVSGSTYSINDPNYSKIRSFNTTTNPTTQNSSINYKSVGYTFTKWYKSFY